MILKNIVLTIFLMTAFVGSAQTSLNDYKYVVVPKKFDDFKKENQYQTSTLVKYLFEKKGFVTIYDDNLPIDLASNRCLGLYVKLVDNSSMFTTKTILALKDCNNQEVLLSREGRSKKKEFKIAFKEAITYAFGSFASLDYSYKAKEETLKEEPIIVSFKNDIKTVDTTSRLEKNQDPVIDQVATKDVQSYKDHSPVESDFKKQVVKTNKKMVEQKAVEEAQSFKSMEPVQSDFKQGDAVVSAKALALYAQEIPNGYQLVDSTPKIQLKIFKSSMPNVYIAKADDKDGVVYTSDGKWFFEYHKNGQVILEELNIKF